MSLIGLRKYNDWHHAIKGLWGHSTGHAKQSDGILVVDWNLLSVTVKALEREQKGICSPKSYPQGPFSIMPTIYSKHWINVNCCYCSKIHSFFMAAYICKLSILLWIQKVFRWYQIIQKWSKAKPVTNVSATIIPGLIYSHMKHQSFETLFSILQQKCLYEKRLSIFFFILMEWEHDGWI